MFKIKHILTAATIFLVATISYSLLAQTESTAGYYATMEIEGEDTILRIKHWESKPSTKSKDVLKVQETELLSWVGKNEDGENFNILGEDIDIEKEPELSDKIKRIKFEVDKNFKPKNMHCWFGKFYILDTIEGLENLNTEETKDMSYMFESCWKKLKSLDLSSFNTENVENMSGMFRGCGALETLNISSFNTSKVTTMEEMFNWCQALETLDLSHFNTENVENMESMFRGCDALKVLNISSFNTSKVTSMSSMFSMCYALETLDLSHFNTESVEDMSFMFNECTALKTLNTSSFNIKRSSEYYTDHLRYMFYRCESLELLDFSGFDLSVATDIEYMFCKCSSLNYIFCDEKTVLPNTSNITSAQYCFSQCSTLVGIKADGNEVKWDEQLKWNQRDVSRNYFKFADDGGFFTKKRDVFVGVLGLEKTTYKLGEELDLQGGYIAKWMCYGVGDTLKLSLCSLEDLASTIKGFDNKKPGKQTVRVEYGGKEYSFTVEVEGKEGGDEPGSGEEPSEGGEEGGDDPIVAAEDLVCGAAAFEVWTSGGVLSVSVARAGVLEVLGVNGVLLRRISVVAGGSLNLALGKGVYVLRLGGDVRKVVME